MFFLAWRHLTSRPRQTVLTLAGITLGTAAYVAISGMMIGFQTFIIDQLVNNDAHIRISAREEYVLSQDMRHALFPDDDLVSWVAVPSGRRDSASILAPQTWLDRLDRDDDVVAYSPQFVTQVLVARGKISLSGRLVGTDPVKQSKVTNIEKYMTAGRFESIGYGGRRVVVGEGLLKKLGAALHDNIFLSTGRGSPQPFRIEGVFRLGVKTLDETMVFGALADAQNLNGTPSRVTDIAVRLRQVERAAEVASQWSLFGSEKVQSWDQANEGIMSVFKTQDIVRNSMTVSILIVAAFGIYNILSMAIQQKKRDIAILRSVGYLPRDILRLFMIQGIFLGFVGGMFGDGLGWVACKIISQIPVSADRGLGGSTMLVSFQPIIYLKGFLLAFLSASLASVFPARSAGKLTPIEIIRSGAL